MDTIEIRDCGVIQTRLKKVVGRNAKRRWAIFGEYFNPMTFSVERSLWCELTYPYYLTKKTAEAILERDSKNEDWNAVWMTWFSAFKEGIERRAQENGVAVKWVA